MRDVLQKALLANALTLSPSALRQAWAMSATKMGSQNRSLGGHEMKREKRQRSANPSTHGSLMETRTCCAWLLEKRK